MGWRQAPERIAFKGDRRSRSKRRISIFHQNICGVRTNKELLEIHLECESPDILCLSEHNLSQEQFDSFCLPNYSNLTSFCCKSRQKGGVCLLAKHNLECDVIDVSQFCSENCCHLAASKIYLTNNDFLIVLVVYRIPGYNCDDFFVLLSQCLDYILQKPRKLVILGDFNIDVMSDRFSSVRFIHIMKSYGLRFTISTYTREVKHSKTAIDNIFTNIDCGVFNSKVLVTGLSDHHGQEAVITVSPVVEKKPLNSQSLGGLHQKISKVSNNTCDRKLGRKFIGKTALIVSSMNFFR